MKIRLSTWLWILGTLLFVQVTHAEIISQGEVVDPEAIDAEGDKTKEVITKPPLTGDPQIDYQYDPNLPHELRNYDLSNYPFYKRVPETIDKETNFTCDDHLDGFYASPQHKCQVYHNCLFGTRYDFLCANYTAFDQKNFICHYVNEVDCENSANYYSLNDALYKEATTTTVAPPQPQIIYVNNNRRNRPRPNNQRRGGNRKPIRRPKPTTTTQAPIYDDYYYDDQYYDDYYDYYDYAETTTTTTTTTPAPRRNRPLRNRRPLRQRGRQRNNGGGQRRRPEAFSDVFDSNNRPRPKINPPVPINDRLSNRGDLRQNRRQSPQAIREQENFDYEETAPRRQPDRNRRPPVRRPNTPLRPQQTTTEGTTTTTSTEAPLDADIYDEYYDYYADQERQASKTTTTTPRSAPVRNQDSKRRPTSPRFPSIRDRVGHPQEPPTETTTVPPSEQSSPVEPDRPSPSRPIIRRRPLIGRATTTTEPAPVQEEPTEKPRSARLPTRRPLRPRPSPESNPRQSERESQRRPSPPQRNSENNPRQTERESQRQPAPPSPQRSRQPRPPQRPSSPKVEVIEEAPPLAPGINLDQFSEQNQVKETSIRDSGFSASEPAGQRRRGGQIGTRPIRPVRPTRRRRPQRPVNDDYYDY